MMKRTKLRGCRGVTLIELMVTITVMSIAIVCLIATFGGIQKGIQNAKNSTVASNLCREKIEVLKDIQYNRLIATTQADLNTYGYDNTNFLPELSLVSAGIRFKRYVIVRKVQEDVGGNIIDLSPASPDNDLKKVETWVEWQQGSETKRYSMASLRENPNRTSLNGTISGVVYASPGGVGDERSDVAVMVLDNPSWTTQTDAGGNYLMKTSTGAHSLRASLRGYFHAEAGVTAAPLATQNFTLSPRGSALVHGQAYIRDHLVLSQVVASSGTQGGVEVEFVELYNPTTYTWTLDSANLELMYRQDTGTALRELVLTFVNDSLPPQGYYLIASTSPINFLGSSMVADATYDSTIFSIVDNQDGGVGIRAEAASAYYDRVAWTFSNNGDEPPEFIEAAPVGGVNPGGPGLRDGEQLVRKTNATAIASGSGRAYDSNSNNADWVQEVVPAHAAQNSTVTEAPTTGTPAVGAVISANDDLSSPSAVTSATGYFLLTGIATTTVSGIPAAWTVSLASGRHYISSANVSLTAGEARDFGTMALTQTASDGIITGTVFVSTGGILRGITVRSGGVDAVTNDAGVYQLVLSPGSGLTVTANPGNLDSTHSHLESVGVTVTAGQTVSGIDFMLDPVGKITGTVTSNGTDPLPDIVVKAEAPFGTERMQAISAGDGTFTLDNLPVSSLAGVGAYTVAPSLDPSESAAPASLPGNVTLGATTNVGIFTVSGSLGKVSGYVKDNGVPITTGVLIIATTSTIAADPPLWNESIRSGPDLYYASHSQSAGSYELSARVSATTYNVYAWYSKLSGEVATTVRKTATVTIADSTIVYPVNFDWP